MKLTGLWEKQIEELKKSAFVGSGAGFTSNWLLRTIQHSPARALLPPPVAE